MANKVVVVTGDVTADWNLARSNNQSAGSVWNPDNATSCYLQPGGAALLATVITAVAAETGNHDLRCMAMPEVKIFPGDSRFRHSYALWSPFKYSTKSNDTEDPVWRVEQFLGLDSGKAEGEIVFNDPSMADLIVLDDAALGFRDTQRLWPKSLNAMGQDSWILLKMARPVAKGPLWEHLHKNCADRLIAIMSVDDLRRTEVQISREISWERTAQDLAWELIHNPRLNALSHCAHVVISFETAGAFLLSRSRSSGDLVESHGFLFFDPKVVEGMWNHNHPGGLIGYTTCLTAGIARQFLLSQNTPNLHQGIQNGLCAMRKLHQIGYGKRTSNALEAGLAFPVSDVLPEFSRNDSPFAVAKVEDPVRFLNRPAEKGSGFWTILKDRYPETLQQVAQEVVLSGAEVALKGTPLGQFGALLTVDRHEIESYRSIRALVSEYCSKERQERPLSIAVFGAPGSGKSFGILQVAKSLLPPDQIEKLTFNLSQFEDIDQFFDALHRVRDAALSGKVPLVFWDEFDTALDGHPLGWLRHFLAPMQDGNFQHGQLTHFIGKAIFVFAGGTSPSMEIFDKGSEDVLFRQAKGPDFVSRLKGYVNVLGPNPQNENIAEDPYYIIRRAILFRSMLFRQQPQLFRKGKLNIDLGVLRAFLHTRKFKHGARSMESIIDMSQLSGKTRYERSSLPTEAQLDLHVNGVEFLALVQQIVLTDEILVRLAAAAHKIYMEGKLRDGWRLGSVKDEKAKTHPLLIPYDQLPEWAKESNKETVRAIPQKLAMAGFVMIPSRSNQPALEFPGEDLEKLAQFEHELWMLAKIADGWQLGKETPENPKQNEYLVPWEKVPEEIRQIDRDLVKGIPRVLAEAGYAVVKAG